MHSPDNPIKTERISELWQNNHCVPTPYSSLHPPCNASLRPINRYMVYSPTSYSSLTLPRSALNHLVVGREVETNAVDAVSLIRRRGESFALEYVTKVATAVGANDFGPGHAESTVFMSSYSARDAVEVSRPSAAGFELVIGLVERRIASSAGIHSFFRVVLVKLA